MIRFRFCFVSSRVSCFLPALLVSRRCCSGSSSSLSLIMVSRLLIGDNNLTRFWHAHQFSRPNLKNSSLITATDLDTLDHALSQSDEREQVIVCVLTSIMLEEVNSLEVSSSALNVCSEVVSRLASLGDRSPGCQVQCFVSLVHNLSSCFHLCDVHVFNYPGTFSVLSCPA